jgi:pimeloyl-ACP methyl ester carboxylesterase
VVIAWERRSGDVPEHRSGEPTATSSTIVLVHGLGYARRGWGRLPTHLTAAGHDVVLVDNRGIGESAVPPGPYTADQMATDVLAVLDDAELEHVHLVGSSLGGMIAQEVAIRWPQRVQRLVLLSTTPGGSGAAPMPRPTVDLLGELPDLPPLEALRRAIANALGPVHTTDALVDEILEQRRAAPQDPAGWQAQAHAGTTYDGGGRIGRVRAPTLVLHGDQDVVVAPANGRLLAQQLPDARLVLLEGHGHLPFWEDPATVARHVLDFLG